MDGLTHQERNEEDKMITLLNYTNSTITQEREWALQLNREFYACA